MAVREHLLARPWASPQPLTAEGPGLMRKAAKFRYKFGVMPGSIRRFAAVLLYRYGNADLQGRQV